MPKSTCCIHECVKPVYGNLLCSMHYTRMYVHGTTNKPAKVTLVCKMPSCTRGRKSAGLCAVHYNKHIRPKVNPPCVIKGCDKTAVANFLCGTHYGRLREYGTTNAPRQEKPKCRMPSCDKPSRSNRWCMKHNQRIKTNGSPFDKDQSWVLSDRGDCIVCGSAVPEGIGFRRYCGGNCASLHFARGGLVSSKSCVLCGDEFSLLEASKDSGRRRYASATTCRACSRTPRLTHHVPTLVARDGNDCRLCKSTVDLSLRHPDPMSRSVDHVIPRSLGGPDHLENYSLTHLICNIRKGANLEYVA